MVAVFLLSIRAGRRETTLQAAAAVGDIVITVTDATGFRENDYAHIGLAESHLITDVDSDTNVVTLREGLRVARAAGISVNAIPIMGSVVSRIGLAADAAIGATDITLTDVTDFRVGDRVSVVGQPREIESINVITRVVTLTEALDVAVLAAGIVATIPLAIIKQLPLPDAGKVYGQIDVKLMFDMPRPAGVLVFITADQEGSSTARTPLGFIL